MFTKKSIFRICSFLLALALTFSALGVTPAHAAGIRYAKTSATGTGDCSSWADACILQTALTGAVSGDEIWVAAGTYKTTTGIDRTATFQLKDGVALYGGFAGTETARDQRNPAANAAILSGDLNGDDVGFTNNTENVYHVVTGANGATLDGFTITAGNANGTSDPTKSGGGMYNLHSSPTLTNVTFSGNFATNDGGGMSNYGSSPTLTNVTFSGNTTDYRGGGMCNTFSFPMLTNVTFSSNSAIEGGGMSDNTSSPTLTNVTFSGNTATNYGGGMHNRNSSSPTIRNTIFWSNTATTAGAQIYNDASSPVVSDSVVQGGYAGTNIITADPMLGTLGNYGGFTQTLPLLPGSSAIDTGDDAVCPATDQRGVTRPQGAHCDIGAYEVSPILLAVPGGQTSGLCESWANACELSYALTGAVSGDEIWVAAGTYKPTTGIDRTATFQLKDGVALYGGFAGTEAARTQRNPAANVTTLSGDLNGDDAGFTNNSENILHVVSGATGAILDGFTITAGNANGYPNIYGGGMYNNSSSPTLTNVTFSSNHADNGGGGMFNTSGSNPTLTNVIFGGNGSGRIDGGSVTAYGGGMYNSSSNPTLTNVIFGDNGVSNAFSNSGGGMYNDSSSPTLTNVTFSGNKAYGHHIAFDTRYGNGGGMYNASGSNPALTNVTFSGNSATYGGGGGMYNASGSNPVLTNVTFSGNSATYGTLGACGGGMAGGNPQIRNTIFWGNTATTGAQICGTPSVSDSVVQDGYAGGTNIITTDPMLGALGNYGGFTQTIPLLPGSSAIDTGDDATCATTDQRGVTRSQGAHCDIGAFELEAYTLAITSTSGTVAKNPDQATYHEGDVVQLTATPNAGWSFANWTGGLTGSANPGSVTIHGNTSVTANYTQIERTLFLPLLLR